MKAVALLVLALASVALAQMTPPAPMSIPVQEILKNRGDAASMQTPGAQSRGGGSKGGESNQGWGWQQPMMIPIPVPVSMGWSQPSYGGWGAPAYGGGYGGGYGR